MEQLLEIFRGNAKKHCLAWLIILSSSLSGCALLDMLPGWGDDSLAKMQFKDPRQKDLWRSSNRSWTIWYPDAPYNQEVEWSYDEHAIDLKLTGGSQLNRYKGVPHATLVRVFQLSDPAAFVDMSSEKNGLLGLLSTTELATGVIAMQDVMLVPGQVINLPIPRQQDSRFIAIVSGFNQLDAEQASYLMPIPVVKVPPSDRPLLERLTFGLLSDDEEGTVAVIRPAHVKLQLELGENRIERYAADAY